MIDFDRMREATDWPSEVVEALMDLDARLSKMERAQPGAEPAPGPPANPPDDGSPAIHVPRPAAELPSGWRKEGPPVET